MRRMVRERPECEAFVKDDGTGRPAGTEGSASLAEDQAAEESPASLSSVVVPVNVSISHS